jgi:microcystin-dependent protein
MPYIVNFTDRQNKVPITVYDNTSSTDTSLIFPGRNVTGYGQLIAENFLALLENFSKADPPVNPTEGQLWYDSANGIMMLWDNVQWKAASNIQKGVVEPSVADSKLGELWVDTTNQQLYVFSGTRWVLIGPNFSTGLKSGPLVEQIDDSDGIPRIVLNFYVEDIPVFIISKDSFTPKISITGFTTIRSGLNVTSENIDDTGLAAKLYASAASADALTINNIDVPAGKFLRTDTINTTEFGLNVRNNAGIAVGVDGNFSLTTSTTSAKIYNSAEGSSIDIQTNRGSGIPETIVRIFDNRVGINLADPNEVLDVNGNIAANGSLIVTNTTQATNLTNGTIRTAGGASIAKNLIVGDGIQIFGTSNTHTIQPSITEVYDLGSTTKRWNTIRSKSIEADTIVGSLQGNIDGNATTATNLRSTTTFSMTGDVSAPSFTFDGLVGGSTKTFNTILTANIITSKSFPFPNTSTNNDTILVFRAGTGLIKQTRDVFVADLGVPVGAIIPFAGSAVPDGYLLCDGSEVEREKFRPLFDVIGVTYGITSFLAGSFIVGRTYVIEFVGTTNFTAIGASTNAVGISFTATGPGTGTGIASANFLNGVDTFRLPDLRGRFPLGRDNMDNSGVVPNITGGFIDAGGGNADRVPGTAPDNLGGSGGQSSNTLIVGNLPQHEHDMKGSTGQQYYATRIDTAAPLDVGAFSEKGPTTVGQSQSLPSSGGIRTGDTLGQPFAVMNPYLTLNYIIRSGPPRY